MRKKVKLFKIYGNSCANVNLLNILLPVFLNILDKLFSISGIKSWLNVSKLSLITELIISPSVLSPPKRLSRTIFPLCTVILMSNLLTMKCVWPFTSLWTPLRRTSPFPCVKFPDKLPAPLIGKNKTRPSITYFPTTHRCGSSMSNVYFDAYSIILNKKIVKKIIHSLLEIYLLEIFNKKISRSINFNIFGTNW